MNSIIYRVLLVTFLLPLLHTIKGFDGPKNQSAGWTDKNYGTIIWKIKYYREGSIIILTESVLQNGVRVALSLIAQEGDTIQYQEEQNGFERNFFRKGKGKDCLSGDPEQCPFQNIHIPVEMSQEKEIMNRIRAEGRLQMIAAYHDGAVIAYKKKCKQYARIAKTVAGCGLVAFGAYEGYKCLSNLYPKGKKERNNRWASIHGALCFASIVAGGFILIHAIE